MFIGYHTVTTRHNGRSWFVFVRRFRDELVLRLAQGLVLTCNGSPAVEFSATDAVERSAIFSMFLLLILKKFLAT